MSYSDLTGITNSSLVFSKQSGNSIPLNILLLPSTGTSSINSLSFTSGITSPTLGSKDSSKKSETPDLPKILIPFVSCFRYLFKKKDSVISGEQKLANKFRAAHTKASFNVGNLGSDYRNSEQQIHYKSSKVNEANKNWQKAYEEEPSNKNKCLGDDVSWEKTDISIIYSGI